MKHSHRHPNHPQSDTGALQRRHKAILENHPLGVTVAVHLAVEHVQRMYQTGHHPMKLGIAIQFWEGDKAEALQLARFLSDLEPRHRDDVVLILAGRFDIPEKDKAVQDAMFYCGRKFATAYVRSKRIAEGHPAGCFGLWSGTVEACYELYADKGWPIENVFFVEAEGVPTRFDWIDWLKQLHQKNLDAGFRVTGPRMEASQFYPAHINGTLCMHMSCWADYPSLAKCPSHTAWDCFHGQVLLGEAGPSQAVSNLYGAHGLGLSVYKTLARDHAWIASVKDESAWKCAQTLLPKQWSKLFRTTRPRALWSTPTFRPSMPSMKLSNSGRSKSGKRPGSGTGGSPSSSSARTATAVARRKPRKLNRASAPTQAPTPTDTTSPATCDGSPSRPSVAG